jgi:hypothetical protein
MDKILRISWAVTQQVAYWVALSSMELVIWESEIFIFIWQCTWGHLLTALWCLVDQKEHCNPNRIISHNCEGLVIVTFCWLTGWHQAERAWELSDFRARNMHESTFPFSPLCRTVPCTKGMYCILQLDCSVYTRGQRQNLRIGERMWCAECILNIVLRERNMYGTQSFLFCVMEDLLLIQCAVHITDYCSW